MSTEGVEISNRKDILLLLLYVPGITREWCEPIRGRTRIMKLVYLFEKEVYRKYAFDKLIPEDKMHHFEAYKYGPFSVEVFKDLNFFSNIKFIEETGARDRQAALAEIEEFQKYLEEFILDEEDMMRHVTSYEEVELRLTEEGKQFAQNLFKRLSEKQREALTDFKTRYNRGSLNFLLTYVYQTYPEDAEKSEIRGKILDE